MSIINIHNSAATTSLKASIGSKMWVIPAFILALGVLFGSWYTVDQKNMAVVLRNGALSSVETSGLHFKFPFIDSVHELEILSQKRTYEKMMSYSKDAQTADLRVSVNYHLDPKHVESVFKTYGTDYVNRLLDPQVYQRVKEVVGKRTALELVGNRDIVGADAFAAVASALEGTGVIVESLQLENIDLSDAYEKAVEQAMRAEAEKKEAEFNAQRDVAKAKGAAESVMEEAKGVKVMADARAYEIQKRGQALRENPALVEMTIAEKWNGVLPTQMVPGGAVPFINLK